MGQAVLLEDADNLAAVLGQHGLQLVRVVDPRRLAPGWDHRETGELEEDRVDTALTGAELGNASLAALDAGFGLRLSARRLWPFVCVGPCLLYTSDAAD